MIVYSLSFCCFLFSKYFSRIHFVLAIGLSVWFVDGDIQNVSVHFN